MSEQTKMNGRAGSRHLTTWLAWAMLALALVLIVLQQWIFSLPHPQPLDIETSGNSPFAFVGLLAFSIVGALIITRYPRHPIGWIFSGAGLLVGLTAFTTAYAQYATMVPSVLPARDLADVISGISFFTGFILPITFGLLLFPDGHLPSRRWSPLVWFTVVGFILLFTGNALHQYAGPSSLDLLAVFGGFAILVSIVASAASLVLRWQRAQGDERQQLKWIGSAAAVLIVIFVLNLAATLLDPSWGDSGLSFVLLTFAYSLIPIAAGIAILRYRLYNIDLLINRTLVYAPLTGILAGIFAASITLSQKLFVALTGQSSDAATVLTTLIVVAAFDPLKTGLQHLVERRFKDAPDASRTLNALGDQMRAVLQVLDVQQMTRRVLEESVNAFGARGGAILRDAHGAKPVQTFGEWNDDAQVTVPLQNNGRTLGVLALAARRNGAEYTTRDREQLQQIADLTARAIALDERANGVTQ